MNNQLIKTTGLGKENVFPRTRILDLFDDMSGLKLIDILKSFNMMFVPYLGNKPYTRNQVSPELRRQGLWLTYVIDSTVYTEWYDEVAIDDTNWGSDSNWRQGSNALVGDLSISPNGTWVINGEDSGITIKGDKGDSPIIRIYDNKILVSYDKGVTYEDLNNTPVYTKFRFNSLTNTYLVSYDLGANWEDISDEKVYHKFRYNSTTNTYLESLDFGKTWSNISAEKVYTKFRFNRSTNTYQVSTDLGLNWTDVSSDKVYYQFKYNRETNTHLVSTDFGATWTNVSEDKVFYLFRTNNNRLLVSTDLGTTWENCSEPIAAWFRWADASGTGNIGKVLISRDNNTWKDLSPTITNNLYIKGYVAAVGNLPSNAAIGDIYMVGPTYDESDTTHDYPHYRMWVKLSSGWVDNGEFTNAGPVGTNNIINGAVTEDKLNLSLLSSITNVNRFIYGNGHWGRFIKELYICNLPEGVSINDLYYRMARHREFSDHKTNWLCMFQDKDDDFFGVNIYDHDNTFDKNLVLGVSITTPKYKDVQMYIVLDWDYLYSIGGLLPRDTTPLNEICLSLDKNPAIKTYLLRTELENHNVFTPSFMEYIATDIRDDFLKYIENIEVTTVSKYPSTFVPKEHISVYYYRHLKKSENILSYIQLGLVIIDDDTNTKKEISVINYFSANTLTLSVNIANKVVIKVTVKPEIFNLPEVSTDTITFIESKNRIKTLLYSSYNEEDINYSNYFSAKLLRNCYSSNTTKEYLRNNLAPFLEVGKIVVNGGILKSFNKDTWNREIDMFDVFEECPYKYPSILYTRMIWGALENTKNVYTFDSIENILKSCILKKARAIIGLPIMAYTSKSEYGGFDIDSKSQKRYYSVPQYLYEELKNSDYPMYEDDLYAIWYSPNYDSPLLLERTKALLNAFSTWLEGNIDGTSIKRRDVIFAIEQRYLGYWGEGSTRFWPNTDLYNEYNKAYFDIFPDKLIIMGGQEFLQLPLYKNDFTSNDIIRMRHIYKSITSKNSQGNIGIFRDSWKAYSMYDIVSDKVIMDDDNNVILLANKLTEILPNTYTTGEFGYIEDKTSSLIPYSFLYESFKRMRLSGISMHNYTIISTLFNLRISPLGLYLNGRDCASMIGYRIVINTPTISKNINNYSVKIIFCNIGLSKVFANYYKVHLIVRKEDNSIISDTIVDFDFYDIPTFIGEPLEYNPTNGKLLEATIPLLPEGVATGKVYLRIDDEKGIEYPMTLSNYGRLLESEGGDGSYLIGTITN